MNDYVERITLLVKQDRFRLTEHADKERENDGLKISDLRNAFATSVLIEDYPEDQRGHSSLILGYDRSEKPIHIVCAIDKNDIVIIITVYIPTMPKWKSPTERNK